MTQPRLAPFLRTLAKRGQYGHSRKPDNFFMSEGGCSFYWDNPRIAPHFQKLVPDQQTWDRVARLSRRYLRFVDYCREVAPQWIETGRSHFADNSVEATQFSARLNQTRQVRVCAPGGDACY